MNSNTDCHSFIASTIPAWQAECLKTQRRGTLLLVSFGGCIALGLTLSYWLSFGFSYVETSSVAWRFPIAFAGVFILPALLLVSFLPESPRYLLLCGKEQEALNVLSALEELPADHEDVRREVLLIKNTVLKLAGGSSMSAVFTMGKERNLHRVILAGKSYIVSYVSFRRQLTISQLCYSSCNSLLESTSSFNSWDLCSDNSLATRIDSLCS
jgi:MFS family permease